MDYIIKNNKQVYIRINNGKVETCAENFRGIFTEQKAKNILNSLPKTLKRYNFHVEAMPDITPKVKETKIYEIPEEVSQWINKFGTCGEILAEAKARSDILVAQLNTCDEELIDIAHEAELESNLNMYKGYLVYVRLRDNRRKRRKLKDELMIISDVLDDVSPSKLHKSRIQKAVNGLLHRKYKYRITEVEDEGDM